MFRPQRPESAFRPSLETLESRITPSANPLADVVELCPAVKAVASPKDSSAIAGAAAKGHDKTPYTYWVTGKEADKDANPKSGGLALVGGGTDVDRVFTWMGEKANHGDFLVIRASGTNAYNKYIEGLVPKLDSVATLLIPSLEAANDPFVANTIRHAEAVFIAGGDQADYVNFWTNTALEDALYDSLRRHVPIGGTSAGLAILGDIDFSARIDTVTSAETLANPYDSRITLDDSLLTPDDAGGAGTPLRFLNDAVTDSHFMQRDRMGRLVTFLGRMDADNLVPGAPRGIAINEETALLVEESGLATVVGNAYYKKVPISQQLRSVYLLQGTAAPSIVAPNTPLTYQVLAQRANYTPGVGGDTLNLNSWIVNGASSYTISASRGILSGSIYG